MILERNNDLSVTAIVSTQTDKTKRVTRVDMYLPDFDVTVHGEDFLSAFIKSELVIMSLYESNISRGIVPVSKMSNEEAQNLCTKSGMYVIYIQVKFSGGGSI